MTGLLILCLLLVSSAASADEKASCSFQDKDSLEFEPAENCGSITADGLLLLDEAIIERAYWNKYGLNCAFVYGTDDKNGWYFINQNGRGRVSPFIQDNDCAPFTAGMAAGLSHGKVVFYNQALEIVKRTDYVWASGFHGGVAKVCEGELIKQFDSGGEHFEYRGGNCGFIDTSFRVVVPVTHAYENTPEPEGL